MNNRPHPIKSSQYYGGLQYGYIILPSDVDRATFIEQCYRWERVSILIEKGGGVSHECYITKSAIRDIEFPADYKKLGSCVMFLMDPNNGLPMVIGVLSKEDESQLLREGFFKITEILGDGSVTVSGDAKTGVLNLTVNGGSLSQLNISVANKDRTAVVNLRCNGNINIELDDTLKIVSSKDVSIEAKEALALKSKTATLEVEDTFKINTGSEAMVKGDELQTQLNKTNDLLQALVTILNETAIPEPGAGAPSALQLALKTAIIGKALGSYTDIKSTESFLD
jgi:hypothetical protein